MQYPNGTLFLKFLIVLLIILALVSLVHPVVHEVLRALVVKIFLLVLEAVVV